MPKVSVLMPVYKTPVRYLREAIESILGQTFTDFEFLILDDCPEEPREEIVKSYQDARIKYFKNEKNLGISLSRNKLIELAKGEYLAVFDHDDISLPERLEKEAAFLDTHPEVGVVGCQSREFCNKSSVSAHPSESFEIKLALIRSCAIVHSAAMIRKSVLTASGVRYNPSYSPAEDYALWLALAKYTEFYNIDEVLFLYRNHDANTSKSQNAKMLSATARLHAVAKHNMPLEYEEFLGLATKTTRLKLFGVIPFIKTVCLYGECKVYLFEVIKLFSYKTKLKLGKRMR